MTKDCVKLRWPLPTHWVLLLVGLTWANNLNLFAQQHEPLSPRVREKGEHHRVWENYRDLAGPNGERIYSTNTVVELASGLHYWDGKQWQESKEEIEIIGNKAVARKGAHKVVFSGNIAIPGAIEVTAADGKKFRSQVVGLSYFDAKTGESVMIAEVKSAEGFILPPNQVIYADAFTDIQADVRYTYTKAGLEQDVILRQAPPSPAEFGLDPATTRLEVLTEFPTAPNVKKEQRVIRAGGQQFFQGRISKTPDFFDQNLDFGGMKMGAGKAFQFEPNRQVPGNTIPVGKTWERMEGRDFLIEGVPYDMIQEHLGNLPPIGADVRQRLKNNKAAVASVAKGAKSAGRMVPRPLAALQYESIKPFHVASSGDLQGKGVVLDYLLLSSSATNMTFAGDTTYLISGEVVLEGTTTFEGGAIIKYTNNVANTRLRLKGPVVWDTAPYRPAIFTAIDDNTVGENITGSTGNPTNYYAATALLFDNGQQNDVRHVRVSHAATAIDGAAVTVTHGQFVNSGNGLSLSGNNFALRNVLFSGVLTNIYSSLAVTGAIEHVTIDRANYLSASATNSLLLMTNSLIYSVTNYGPFSWITNQVAVVSGSSPFTSIGSGRYYLPTNSPYLNIGSTNISMSLRKEFAEMTTAAPLIYTNLVNTNIILTPFAARDTNQPDLGYHYYALDYASSNCWVTNATLTLTNGVAFAGYGDRGFWLMGGGRLVSEGSPLKMNRFIRYAGVQEMPQAWGTVPTQFEMFNPYVDTNTPPTVKFRFCELIATKSDVLFYTAVQNFAGWHVSNFEMRDSFTHGGTFRVDKGGMTTTDFKVINNVFDRTAVTCFDGLTNSYLLNNLHKGGSIYMRRGTNSPVIRDSILIGTSITQAQSVGPAASHNLYVGQTNRFTPISTNDIFTNLTFVAGPLGNYYQTNNSPLSNAGSQSATNVGLYHYTTTTNQFKETNSIVDIGFHYIALDSQGAPIDTDGDGIPDYLEDKNGNGIVDAGETDWKNRDSDYDGRTDSQELSEGTDPTNPASVLPVRLGYWRFNNTNWVGEAGQLPLVATYLGEIGSWSGKAMGITNETSRVVYRELEDSGKPNFNLRSGSMRFWFKPSWTSVSAGGSGNGYWSRLINVGSWSSDSSYGAWYLGMFPSGDGIYLMVQANGQDYAGSAVPCSFKADNWYEIVVTYTPTSYLIYINGELKGTNGGIGIYPSAAVRATGIVVGTSWGGEPCLGAIDELETFNYPLSGTQVATDYMAKFIDSDYDGRTDFQEWEDGTNPYDASSVIQMRLGYWKFNNTNWLGEAGQVPLVATNLSNPVSWSGNALGIDGYATNLHLLNIDISGSTPTTMVGGAAYGKATNDYWNTYYGASSILKTVTNLLWSDQSNSFASITVSNAPGSWGMSSATGNRMYDDYNYPWGFIEEIGITFSNLTTGYYDFYLYCHGANDYQNSAVNVYSGTTHAGGGFTAVASDYASTNWLEGKQYVRVRDIYASSNTLARVVIGPDASAYAVVNGIQVAEKKVAQLKYRDQEYLGNANINLANGTIRFWFRPNWSSTNSAGNGPDNEARLIDVGCKTSSKSNGWWGLHLSNSGNQLKFSAQGNGTDTNFLSGNLDWNSGSWHQVVLTYTTTNSILYLDGQSVTNGMGSTLFPGALVRAGGFSVGSDYFGLKQAEGHLDELETFNYVLSAEEVMDNYQHALRGDSDGDGLADFLEYYLGLSASTPNGVPSLSTQSIEKCPVN